MKKKLVLFDIDGTLLLTKGAGRRAIRRALEQEIGIADGFESVRFDGKTDPQIVREILTAAGYPESGQDERIEATCRLYVELLEDELAGERTHSYLLEGVAELLDAVEERAEAVLGLLTGNVHKGAQLKLRAAGLDADRFSVGAFGSDAEVRSDLPPVAARRAEEFFGRTPSGEEIIIIGDTPADMTCGAGVGARPIGVATGSYDSAALSAAGAHSVFETLADVHVVMESIFD